jgi:bacteriocin-like protein
MINEAHELNTNELDSVSGGNPVLVGIALGVAGNAVYDFMKEHHGLSDAIDAIKQQAGK